MKRWISTGIALSLLLFWTAGAHAKWWVFGRSEEAVTIDYLYINQIVFEESESRITLFKQFLPGGMVVIRGKASAARGTISTVRVSIDNRNTWQDAQLSAEGVFEFRFRPEENSRLDLYVQAMDAAGKTNDVDQTHKQITLSDKNTYSVIQEVMRQIVAAYQTEDHPGFMQHVAENFTGDRQRFDFAVRRDFSLFADINIDVSISNVAVGANGHIYVSLSYSRFVVPGQSNRPLQDRGLTELVFAPQGDLPKLWAMKYPLIFGISDAADMATGMVISDQNNQTLVVDDQGNAAVMPLSEAIASMEKGLEIGGIPSPTIVSVSGLKHHYIDLEIRSDLDSAAAQGVYDIIVQESIAPNGPWEEIDRRSYDTVIMNLSTARLITQRTGLYYRVIVQKTSNGDEGQPSNVMHWDNT